MKSKDDLICVCGHTKIHHFYKRGRASAWCQICWNIRNYTIPEMHWQHNFKLDNLKYLEDKYEKDNS